MTTPAPKANSRRTERLTVAEICADLKISRSTFYDWRAKERAPRCIRLPNGELRVCQAEYERWLESLSPEESV
jgi:predicted DNA-binding transcriptional regulator AlpA